MRAELRLALELAEIADDMTLAHFRSGSLEVERKPDLTEVTHVDRGVERALRERIARDRPGDGVLGEEYGLEDEGASARWILDPIDGTRNYTRGIPVYATLIALQVDGRVEVGVASAPALGHRWWAARGDGAFADGRPIHVSSVLRLEDAAISYPEVLSFSKRGLLEQIVRLDARSWHPRGFGDFWQHVLVAEGALDVAIEPVASVWDLAALQVIVEEAGGRLTDFAGEPRADGGDAIVSNGLLHEELLELLR
jgi:histidinol-phosphatase